MPGNNVTDDALTAGAAQVLAELNDRGLLKGVDEDLFEEIGQAVARAALEAALADHVVGWRPMDSVPKDGTRFWGKVDDDAIAMLWHSTFEAFVSSWRRMEMAAGYTIDNQSFKEHSPVIHKPEAWMPPAAPPVKEG